MQQAAPTSKHGFFHMPKAFYPIILIEFWERFAFYGLQSVAVLFFIKSIHLNGAKAGTLFASFSAFLYGMLVIGGYLGDKVIGIKKTYLLGIIFLMIGYGMFAFITTIPMIYLGMGVILVGNIFFKTNAGNFVSRCFKDNDPRLDSAFTYFYMSINVGSIFSQILIPFIALKTSYHFAIGLCGIGLFISLITFFIFRHSFDSINNVNNIIIKKSSVKIPLIVAIGIIAAYLLGELLSSPSLTNYIFFVSILIFFLIFTMIYSKIDNQKEKMGMKIALIMLVQAVIFFVLYTQVSTSLTLFAEQNVNRNLFGILIPAGVTQAYNPIFITMLSPILANLYMKYENKKAPISIPAKFTCGILTCAIAYLILTMGCHYANQNGQVSMIWLFLGYGFYSLGELLVSAIGLSMVAKLFPKRLGGFAQASWFITSAIGFKLGGMIAATAEPSKTLSSIVQLHNYQHLFTQIGIVILVIGVITLAFTKRLTRTFNRI